MMCLFYFHSVPTGKFTTGFYFNASHNIILNTLSMITSRRHIIFELLISMTYGSLLLPLRSNIGSLMIGWLSCIIFPLYRHFYFYTAPFHYIAHISCVMNKILVGYAHTYLWFRHSTSIYGLHFTRHVSSLLVSLVTACYRFLCGWCLLRPHVLHWYEEDDFRLDDFSSISHAAGAAFTRIFHALCFSPALLAGAPVFDIYASRQPLQQQFLTATLVSLIYLYLYFIS